MLYSDYHLEKHFEKLVKQKERIIQDKYENKQLKNLFFKNAKIINSLLISYKPNKHQKKHFLENKKTMLIFLDKCINEDMYCLNYKEKIILKESYINKVANRLTFLGVRTTDYIIFFIGFGFLLDIILTIINIASLYFYVPIFTIIISINQIKGLIKAKNKGLLLK